MARIRSVHPGFFTDEDYVAVSMAARLLVIGLGVEADDKGVFPWKPLTIKMRVFPADNVDVEELLSELVGAGVIVRYEEAGKSFGAIRNFRKFQKPKTPNDIHPAPADILEFVGLAEPIGETLPKRFRNASEKSPQMEDGGEEIKEEVVPPTPRKRGNGGKTMIPEDWKLPAKADLPPKARACAEQWTDASYETHGEAFHGYWRSSRRMYADWTATWANRVIALHSQVMRDQKFGNAPTDVPKAANDPEAGKLFQQYQAGEITFEEFHRQREAKAPKRTASTGPPRSIGELAKGVAGAAR